MQTNNGRLRRLQLFSKWKHIGILEWVQNLKEKNGGNTVSEVNIEKWIILKDVQAYFGVGKGTVLAWICKVQYASVQGWQTMEI
jgi:hypothetical protein